MVSAEVGDEDDVTGKKGIRNSESSFAGIQLQRGKS